VHARDKTGARPDATDARPDATGERPDATGERPVTNMDKSIIIFPFSWRFGRNSDNLIIIFEPPAQNRTDFSNSMAQNAIIPPRGPFSRENKGTFVVIASRPIRSRTGLCLLPSARSRPGRRFYK
jgi:hypothetical protein